MCASRVTSSDDLPLIHDGKPATSRLRANGKHPGVRIMVGEKIKAAFLLNREGWSDVRIGKALSMTAQTVAKWRRENHIESRSTPKFNEQTLELYRSGASDGEIAKAFGACHGGATRWRQRLGLAPNFEPQKALTATEVGLAKKLLRTGASMRQVAEAVDRKSLRAVRKMRREMAAEQGLRKSGHSVGAGRSRTMKLDPDVLYQRIKKAIGRGVSADIAADAASDMFLSLMEDRLQADQIEREAPRFVNRVLSSYASRYGPLSIDMQDEDGLSIGDRLVDESAQEDIELAAEGAFADASARYN